MANYTSTTTMVTGRPGTSVDTGTSVIITLTANAGYRFKTPHGLSVSDPQNIFDEESIVRDSDSQVTVTLSVRDDIRFPNSNANVDVRIIGDTERDTNEVVVVLDGDPVDTDGDGVDDTDIMFEDDLGNGPLDSLDVDADGLEGDMVGVGNAILCPIASRRFREDADGEIIFPNPPADRLLGNGSRLVFSNPRVGDNGCIVYTITVVIGSSNSDGTSGGGQGGDLSDGGGGTGNGTFDDVYNTDSDGNNNPIDGGGSETVPADEDPDAPEDAIFDIDINTDNLDRVRGGFVIITATGTPGATTTVRLTPTNIGTGTLPSTIGVINVPIRIESNGIDREIVRIPSIAGDDNFSSLCQTMIPDGVDGIQWDITADDTDVIIEGDTTLMQDAGGQVSFQIASSDLSIPIISNSSIVGNNWIHRTDINGTRGFTFEEGRIRAIIPPNEGGTWTLLDAVNGVVSIDPDTDITCFGGGNFEFCDGTATINSAGSLVITQPYSGGVIPVNMRRCVINLDNLATQDTEVKLNFMVPNGANFSISPFSQSEFAYSGRPGTTVSAGVENQITFTANDGYTWRYTDLAIMAASIVAGDGNADTHITPSSFSFSPTISSLQADGGRVEDITMSWTLSGVFPTPPNLEDTYTITPAGGPRFISQVSFDFGSDSRGQASLVDATFQSISTIEGIESRPWSVNYRIDADTDHTFKTGQTVEGTHHSSTHGATVSSGTLDSGLLFSTGTISGTYGGSNDTVFVDGVGDAFRLVSVTYDSNNSSSGVNVNAGFAGTVNGVEGDAAPTRPITLTTESDQGFTSLPTITSNATISNIAFSGTPVLVDGTSYYPSVTADVDYTFTSTDTQSVTVNITGDVVEVIPATFTRIVVESPANAGIAAIPNQVVLISDSDGDLDIGDETVAIQFDVHTESGFAWAQLATTNGMFSVSSSSEVTNISSEVMDATGNTFNNENAFIRVTATYNVPDNTAGNTTLTATFTIGGNGPLALASITASPGTLTFDADDDTSAEAQTVEVNLSNPTAGIDTITNTDPTNFTVVATDGRNEGANRTFTIYPSSANTSVTSQRTAAVTFASTEFPDAQATVNLVQRVEPLSLSVTSNTITLGQPASSSGTVTIMSNGTLSLDATGLNAGYTATLLNGVVTFTATNANTAFSDASGGSVTITSSATGQTTLTETISVVQTGRTRTITLSDDDITTEGSQTITVTTNDDDLRWRAAVTTDADGIISSLSPTTNSDSDITFTVNAASPGDLAATAVITVTFTDGSTRTINISRDGVDVTLTGTAAGATGGFSQTSRLVLASQSNAGGTGTPVTITSNLPTIMWTATTTASWITLTNASGGDGDDVEYTLDSNNAVGADGRSGTIIVTGSGVTGVIQVDQDAGPAETLTLDGNDANATLSVTNTGGSQSVSTGSNVDNETWTAVVMEDTDSIISSLSASGSVGTDVTFTVASNGQFEPAKTAVIRVTSSSGVIRDITVNLAAGERPDATTVNVTVAGSESDGITDAEWYFNTEGSAIAFEIDGLWSIDGVQPNEPFTGTPRSWVTFSGDGLTSGGVITGIEGNATLTATYTNPSQVPSAYSWYILSGDRSQGPATTTPTGLLVNILGIPQDPRFTITNGGTTISSSSSGGSLSNDSDPSFSSSGDITISNFATSTSFGVAGVPILVSTRTPLYQWNSGNYPTVGTLPTWITGVTYDMDNETIVFTTTVNTGDTDRTAAIQISNGNYGLTLNLTQEANRSFAAIGTSSNLSGTSFTACRPRFSGGTMGATIQTISDIDSLTATFGTAATASDTVGRTPGNPLITSENSAGNYYVMRWTSLGDVNLGSTSNSGRFCINQLSQTGTEYEFMDAFDVDGVMSSTNLRGQWFSERVFSRIWPSSNSDINFSNYSTQAAMLYPDGNGRAFYPQLLSGTVSLGTLTASLTRVGWTMGVFFRQTSSSANFRGYNAALPWQQEADSRTDISDGRANYISSSGESITRLDWILIPPDETTPLPLVNIHGPGGVNIWIAGRDYILPGT